MTQLNPSWAGMIHRVRSAMATHSTPSSRILRSERIRRSMKKAVQLLGRLSIKDNDRSSVAVGDRTGRGDRGGRNGRTLLQVAVGLTRDGLDGLDEVRGVRTDEHARAHRRDTVL